MRRLKVTGRPRADDGKALLNDQTSRSRELPRSIAVKETGATAAPDRYR